mmetsp:Transcript_1261/g.3085  ORF Transcript_1261/g.3085 Transcript_1261/m.3085 type:complete len:153 (+) Transcript_1261:41-499(+)|eukprot:CAMPEP_0183435260 /NCGR_PEP_ID=MMETSP0370-20130417/67080_1 /TAXON_ID=268820 /ORGANISM="Peridinium aciculiferum, Strain PAER-2" /LENGTH=152 /DNA_ID=CAMNT_0025622281 /DNA_START=37 /DNA_END=495 /DNA_ORIENTATION=+
MAKRPIDEVVGGAEEGAEVEEASKKHKPELRKGTSTFFLAAEWGKAEEIQILLDDGMDPNAIDPDEDPVLFTASMKGHAAVVKALLESKADAKATNDVGFTALMLAVRGGHSETVKALLAAGSDTAAKNMQGETALDIAHKEGADGCTALLV